MMMVIIIIINDDYFINIVINWFNLGIKFYTSPMRDLHVGPLTEC